MSRNVGITGSGKVDILSELQKAQDKIYKLILCNPKNEQTLKDGMKGELVYVIAENCVEENKVIVVTDEKLKVEMLRTFRKFGKIN